MATASATTGATSSSIKTYVDTRDCYDYLGSFGGTSIASVDFVSVFDTKYQVYVIEVQLFAPVTNTVTLQLRTSTNNGSSWDLGAGAYAWAGSTATAAAVTAIGSTSATSIGLTAANVLSATNSWVSGFIRIMPNNASGAYSRLTSQLTYSNTTGVANTTTSVCSGWRADATTITAVQLLFSSGNVNSGFAKLYGIST